jgi:hypothetical protein
VHRSSAAGEEGVGTLARRRCAGGQSYCGARGRSHRHDPWCPASVASAMVGGDQSCVGGPVISALESGGRRFAG